MSLLAGAHGLVLAVRRRRFLARVAVAARLSRARVRVQVHPSARIGRAVRVRVDREVGGSLLVGAHSRLDDGVEIRLSGGDLCIGEWVEIRRGAALMVAGRVELAGPNLVSWGAVVHGDEHVHLDTHVVLSEHVTITDSTHEHVEGRWHLDQVTTAPVRVGADTWIGAKATITPGVTIGARCVIGAGAVVTRDVPDDHVALGVPARAHPR